MKNLEPRALISTSNGRFFSVITLDDRKKEIHKLPLLKDIKLDHPEVISTQQISAHLTFVKVTHDMLGPWEFYTELPDRYWDYTRFSFFSKDYENYFGEEDIFILNEAYAVMDSILFPQGPLSPFEEGFHEIVKNHFERLQQQMQKFGGVCVGFEDEGPLFVGGVEDLKLVKFFTLDKNLIGPDRDLALTTLEKVLLRNRTFVIPIELMALFTEAAQEKK